MVDAVIGANAPELHRKIMLNLEQEKKILKEGGERNEVHFIVFTSHCRIRVILLSIKYHFEHLTGEEDEEDDSDSHRHRRSSLANAICK